jgi:hypothetical protein
MREPRVYLLQRPTPAAQYRLQAKYAPLCGSHLRRDWRGGGGQRLRRDWRGGGGRRATRFERTRRTVAAVADGELGFCLASRRGTRNDLGMGGPHGRFTWVLGRPQTLARGWGAEVRQTRGAGGEEDRVFSPF